jgi:hypothetical protein
MFFAPLFFSVGSRPLLLGGATCLAVFIFACRAAFMQKREKYFPMGEDTKASHTFQKSF